MPNAPAVLLVETRTPGQLQRADAAEWSSRNDWHQNLDVEFVGWNKGDGVVLTIIRFTRSS